MSRIIAPKERIIVPVDTNNIDTALGIVNLLWPFVGMFKFGLEILNSMLVWLVNSTDDSMLQKVKSLFAATNSQLFWDGKWDDIPNTVAGAATAVSPLAPVMVNVHVSAGMEAIKAAVKNSPQSMVLGVTVLTSIGSDECESIFGKTSREKVVEFAKMIEAAGAHGIVCSPQELELLSGFTNLVKVIPGVRPLWASANDQKRVLTPKQAIDAGADYLVIGRPITNPPEKIGDPVEAVRMIVEEIGG